jgi:hypothetical protein
MSLKMFLGRCDFFFLRRCFLGDGKTRVRLATFERTEPPGEDVRKDRSGRCAQGNFFFFFGSVLFFSLEGKAFFFLGWGSMFLLRLKGHKVFSVLGLGALRH